MTVAQFRKFMRQIGATEKKIDNCVAYADGSSLTESEHKGHLMRFALNLTYWSRSEIEQWVIDHPEEAK